MNPDTPRLRAHLLAELRDTRHQAATTRELAGQVPAPDYWNPGCYRGSTSGEVHRHLVSLEREGQVHRVQLHDRRSVLWRLGPFPDRD